MLPKGIWKNGGGEFFDYFKLIQYGYDSLGITIPFWEGFHESYAKRRDEYERLYEMLADTRSKEVLAKLIDFRVNYNLNALEGFVVDPHGQYFEPFLQLKPYGEAFCDVGGYDGYTTNEFVKRCPHYEKVYFFEPEIAFLKQAESALASYSRIVFCPYAASDKNGYLRFQSDTCYSRVTSEGEIVVEAKRIDDVVSSPVSFLKMDIEGAEAMAIEGARETILKYHPRLAISVYHRGADFVDIPKQVLSIRGDYKLFLRHYTQGIVDTVMFFVPSGE